MEWEDLQAAIAASDCGRMFDGATCVLGRGNTEPKVVFVGEAPGAEEDAQGLPFVGRSGQLLEEWIHHIGLDADAYYITNVLKCRPPGNRNPTADEVETCRPWLDKQLRALDPDVIVCVGRFAMNHFFPKKRSILKESGRLIDGKYYIVPHPSYFIRRGGKGWEEYLAGLRQHFADEVTPEHQETLL